MSTEGKIKKQIKSDGMEEWSEISVKKGIAEKVTLSKD